MRYAPQDEEILRLLAEYHTMSTVHLAQLVHRKGDKQKLRVVQRRLRALRELGLVRSLRLRMELDLTSDGPAAHFLTKKGVGFLSERYGVDAWASERTTNAWLRHDLAITDFHLRLKDTGCLISWTQYGISNQYINPDAFFVWADEESEYAFYLEMEMGPTKTVGHKNTIIEKMERYLEYAPDFKREHGHDFRVILILPSHERVENLMAKCRELDQGLDSRKFWFASNLELDNFLTTKGERYNLKIEPASLPDVPDVARTA